MLQHRIISIVFLLCIIPAIVSAQAQQSETIISGTVVDSASGEPLRNVNLWLDPGEQGTITDSLGQFTIRTQPGTYQLFIQHIGYQREVRDITITEGERYQLEFRLQMRPLRLRGVVVERASRSTYLDAHYRFQGMEPEQGAMPGEPDLFGMLRTLPGIIQVNDLTGNFYVRGGAADQNILLLDGIRIYNPYHLFGLFSGMNIWAVDQFDVYPAEAPLEYSGALSGVIDVKTLDPMQEERSDFHLSPLSTSFVFSGGDEQNAALLSLRRTYLDLISGLMGTQIPYGFYDGNFKYIRRLNQTTRFKVIGYLSQDQFVPGFRGPGSWGDAPEDVNNRWGNRAIGLQLTRSTREVLATLSISLSGNHLDMDAPDMYQVSNLIQHREIRADLVQRLADHVFHAGIYLREKTLDYQWSGDYALELVFHPGIPLEFQYQDERYPYGFYFQYDMPLVSSLLWTVGAAYNRWGETGRASPRTTLKWEFGRSNQLELAFGWYHQAYFQGQEAQEGSVSLPTYFSETPARSRSLSLSYSRELNRYFKTSFSAYWREFSDIPELVAGVRYPSFRYGDGNTVGLEGFLKQGAGDFTYRLGGSLMWNRVNFGGETYAPHWDTPYAINAQGEYQITRGFSASAQIWYQAGSRYTPVLGKYLHMDHPLETEQERATVEFVEGSRNSARFSDYFRVDAGLTYRGTWSAGRYTIYLQIVNLFNTGNILRYRWYDYFYSQAQNGEGKTGVVTGLPFFPSLGVHLVW